MLLLLQRAYVQNPTRQQNPSRHDHIVSKMAFPLFSVTSVVLIILLCIINHFLDFPYDLEEPPLIRPTIPLFGRMIGLVRYDTGHYYTVAFV